jgi:hypothetical protein
MAVVVYELSAWNLSSNMYLRKIEYNKNTRFIFWTVLRMSLVQLLFRPTAETSLILRYCETTGTSDQATLLTLLAAPEEWTRLSTKEY